jgi:nicotinamidase-related amidase
VPNAQALKPTIAYVANLMQKNNVRRVRGRDRHFEDDPELLENNGPFPRHCMDKMYNQTNEDKRFGIDFIKELNAVDTYVLENKTGFGNKIRVYKEQELKEIANGIGDIVFEKQHYDVFTNNATEKVLDYMGVKKAIVYGVATNFCVKAAVLGMQNRGIQTYVVEDAIEGIPLEANAGIDAAIKEMKDANAKFVKANELEKLLRKIN